MIVSSIVRAGVPGLKYLLIRSLGIRNCSFWLGFSSSMMDRITASVSFPSRLNAFILMACASDGVQSSRPMVS